MNSDTSSDLNINFMGDTGNNLNVLKKDTSETDYYLGLIANPSKTLIDEPNSSSSLELSETDKENNNSSSSKPAFEEITLPKFSDNGTTRNDSSEERFSRTDNFSDKRHSNRKHSNRNSDNRHSERIQVTDSEPVIKPKKLTPREVRMKKIEMLRKLSELKLRGYKLSKEYDFNSSIEEMEYEYDMLKSFADKRNGIKLYKNLILNGCSVIEFFNDKYDPFKFKLSGWSEHMNVEVDNYDDVLEELYEKYRGSGGSMPPELKLLLLIMASASAFHFSKNFESKIPGLNKMYTNNAGVIPGMFNGKQKQPQFMSPQELNIQRQREEMINTEKQRKEQMRNQRVNQRVNPQPNTSPPTNLNTNPMFQNRPSENYQNDFHPVGSSNPIPTPPEPMINKSQDVNDILKRLHQNEGTEEESSVNNDRIISDTTISEGGTHRRKKRPMMVIT
jgi:hypothetical protein